MFAGKFSTIVAAVARGLRAADRPVKRWTSEELATRKTELEARLPDPRDVGLALEVSDYLFQRYYPPDKSFGRRRMAAVRARWRRRLARAVKGKTSEQIVAESEFALAGANQKLAARRQVLRDSYVMSADEFRKIFPPLLAARTWAFSAETIERLWLATQPDHYEATAARDQLLGLVHPDMIVFVAGLRRNYEDLRRGLNAGYHWSLVVAGRRCRCEQDTRIISNAQAVRAFEDASALDIIFPQCPSRCRTPLCCATLLARDTDELKRDEEFEEFLERPRRA
jgi:hypothetical protein